MTILDGRCRRLRVMAWMVVLFVAMVAIVSLQALVQTQPPLVRRAAGIVVAAACYALYALAVRRVEKRPPTEIGLAGLPAELVSGLAIGFGMMLAVFACLRLGGWYAISPGHWSDPIGDGIGAMVTGLTEELVFRAIVFRLLMRAFGLWWALVLSAALFGALHLANPNATLFAAIAIAIEAGLMLAAFYLLTGRLWMAVGVHAAWNFTQGPILGAAVSGNAESGSLFASHPLPDAPALLSGGAFGPEASLPAILVGLIVLAVVLAAAQRRGRLAPV